MSRDSNTVALEAVLAAREALRFTPGGVAVVDAVLAHGSTQVEAGHPRRVDLELSARFAASLAERVDRVPLGTALRATGFLAARRQGSKSLRLHVTCFETGAESQNS